MLRTGGNRLERRPGDVAAKLRGKRGRDGRGAWMEKSSTSSSEWKNSGQIKLWRICRDDTAGGRSHECGVGKPIDRSQIGRIG